MTKLLHIGLSKCASTYLQQNVFPKIVKEFELNYINLLDFAKINLSNIKYHILENQKELSKKLPKNFIISNESLFSFGWEFSRAYKSFLHIKNNFTNDTIILIVIRNPYDLLNSIYCQSIQEMKIIEPKNFFFIKETENVRNNNKFNLYRFNYEKLISFYKDYFKKVVVVKYEEVNDLSFLKKIFEVNDEFITNLKKTNKYYNKSISKYGINFTLFLNKFFDIEKNQKYIKGLIKDQDSNFLSSYKNKLLSFFYLRSFILYNKIPYKKYQIDKKFIPLNLIKEIDKYNKLKL